ncbi:MAG: hypothetical protein HYR70_12715 [Chloroflexi bacterium]|nr:hypothetical protein [Chloroflexota bacterium]MBI3339492.1 hypothetical protein [Chloroflexota bacterium]
MAGNFSLSLDYWKTLQITSQDVEVLHTHLFEAETPLTARDLALIFIETRVKFERDARAKERQAGGKTFIPRGKFNIGDNLVFPALGWEKGRITATRSGVNPDAGEFDVITVALADGSEKMFAAGLANHILNEESFAAAEEENLNPETILQENGIEIEKKLEIAFSNDESLVKIAGRWFPRGLLINVNEGHLNLAEAALDIAQGEPQPTSALLKDVELPAGVNSKLAEFSLNYALQDDERFDEVGPSGEVLWCLRRLEPGAVREVPAPLRYEQIKYDRFVLDEAMLKLETQLDDELSDVDGTFRKDVKEVTISLIYPHLRAGTLPLSARTRLLFPTAIESPRVRFTLVDGKSGLRMPAWAVLEHGYVFGLRDWYKNLQLIPGSLVSVKRGQKSGEVIVEARTQRSSKDWVRTLIVGADGGLVFAMLKQAITAEFNDRMAIYVPDFKALDPLWEKKRTFEELVVSVMREMTKLTPQGHVHAQELYAAVNLVRRVPPAPLFALLASQPRFIHVGDLHFRLEEA